MSDKALGWTIIVLMISLGICFVAAVILVEASSEQHLGKTLSQYKPECLRHHYSETSCRLMWEGDVPVETLFVPGLPR